MIDWTNGLFVEIYNVNTANSTWFKLNENIFNFKNVVLSGTFSTQMRTSEFPLCSFLPICLWYNLLKIVYLKDINSLYFLFKLGKTAAECKHIFCRPFS